jgi:hopanoid-associated phosphorylase
MRIRKKEFFVKDALFGGVVEGWVTQYQRAGVLMASQLDFAGGTFVDGLVADTDDSPRVAEAAAVESHRRLVIAFVGLDFEARIAAAPGVQVVCRTAGKELEEIADTAVRQGYRGLISFGVAGGLASHLRPGDWVVASSIREAQTVRATDAVWSRKLLGLIDGAIHAPILGVDSPVAEPAKKRELYRTTGAAVVDMESHVVARVADQHKLAFAALRVVVDPAHRTVPPAALINMRPDGRPDVPAMLRNIAARPSQLSRLARIAVDAFTARAAMNRVRRDIGPHFGLMDHS